MIFSVESPDWRLAFKSGNVMQVELLKNELENNEIRSFIVNKKDSLYPMFGASLLYVQIENAEVAKVIVDAFTNDNETEIK